MDTKKRVTALFMVLSLFLGVLSPAMNVFAMENNKSGGENEACVYEVITTLSDDKQTADVQVTIQPKENITVYSSVLPNGEEREFNTNVIEFQMTENGIFSLGINYQSVEDTEIKKIEIPIEITGIENSFKASDTDIQNNDVDANEEITKKEAKQDVEVIRNFNLSSVMRTSTGTAPFDRDDNPGNDSTKDNNIVRSFDNVKYDMTYAGEIDTTVGQADLEFELSLNVSEKYASFNTEVLSAWMSDIVQKDVNGKCVLTGKSIYQYNNASSTGFQSFSETKLVEVDVKGMNQSEEIIPTFKVKMKDQQNWQEKVMSSDDEKAIVSATPMYDIELVNVGKMNSYNTFDFSSGNAGAPNADKGNVEGRLMDFGVGIRLKAVDSDKGMKGFYIPEKFDDWTFKLNTGIKENGNPSQQQPLLWDYKENRRETTGDNGRDLTNGTNDSSVFAGTLPLTNSAKTSTNSYTTNNGGTWKFIQNADGTIDVTVSGASLYDENGNLIAPTHQGAGTAPLSPAPSQGNLYISTAYFQLVVPVEKSSTENKKCELEITDTDMNVPYIDGQGNEKTATDQTVKDNDRVVKEYETLPNGTYGLFHYLAKENQQSKFWGNNLSSNKSGMGLDAYALKGDTIQVVGAFSYDGDDIKDLNALNLLMKIDDKAMQPSTSASNGTPTSNSLNQEAKVKLLYAAKTGGIGWISDEEMESTREQDLEYFESMADLKAKYPNGVCVAVLAEARNVTKTSSAQTSIGFNVDILDSAKEETVYQTVHTIAFYKKDKNIGVNDTRLNNAEKLNKPTAYIRDNNRYDKAEYDSEHNISNASSQYATYYRGASLLIIGVEAGIEKTVNSKSTSFDLSSSITYIPYKLQPVLNLANKKDGYTVTEMKITDILPKQLTVTKDTKYFYGDKEIIPTVETLTDGRTKLIFTIANVPTGENLPSITFNADIDFNEINLQESKHTLQNTSQIEATGDGRTFSSEWVSHPNQSSATATLIVNKSLNLSKQVLEPILELGQNVRYRVAFTNTQSLDYTNYKMLDVLPYNGDSNGSKFDGKYTTVAELSAPSEIELYATTSEEVRGKDTSTLDMNLFSKMTADSEENGYKHYVLPEGTTAILLNGTLPSMKQYILNITLQPENNLGGNIYGNRAVMEADGLNKLTSALAKAEVVERSLSGVAWIDVNKNGLIDKSEKKLEGLTVNLYQINAITGIEELANDIYGNPCTTKTNGDGSYEFTKLTSGKYRVEFLDDNGNPVNLLDYDITKKNVGKDESINSKADAVLNVDGRMSSAQIADITLPTLDEMVKDNIRYYSKEHQNVGIYQPILDKSVTKVWNDNNNQDGIRPTEVKVQLYANDKAVGEEVTLNADNKWSHTFTGLAKFDGGKEITYSIKEVDVANGYADKVEIGQDGNFTLTNTHAVELIDKSVTKVWDDNNNQDGIRPTEVKVQLYANDKAVGEEVTLNADNKWSHTFTGLAKFDGGKEITYSIKEVDVANGYADKVEIGQDGNFTLTNTHAVELIDKSVTKVWDDNNNQDGIRPTEVKVQLYANDKAVGEEVTLNADNKWSHTFTGLAKFDGGKEITYSIKEVDVANGYTDTVEISDDGNFVITNTHNPNKPIKPEVPNEPVKPNTSGNTPKTGDSTNITLWFSLISTSCVSIFTLLFYRKKKYKKQ